MYSTTIDTNVDARTGENHALTVHNLAASLPLPASATDGVSLDPWKAHGTRGPFEIGWFLDGSAALTFSGAVAVYGYLTDFAKWYYLGVLNNNVAPPVLSATAGFSQIVQYAGGFQRLALGPTTAVAVTVTGGTGLVARIARVRSIEER